MQFSPAKLFLAVLVLAILMLAGCQQNSADPNQDPAPDLPPESSFVMDFSFFDTTTALPVPPGKILTKQNWGRSALVVGIWNVILTVNMAVPVASFVGAFGNDPQLQDDGTWLWTYQVNSIGGTYTANLSGRTASDGVHWEMRLSKSGPNGFSNFLWYEGEHNLVGTQGQWRLNRSPQEPNPYLQIDWHRSSDGATGDIRYLNVVPGSAENGSYIYGERNGDFYNQVYNLYGAATGNLTEIQWSSTTLEGRTRDAAYFGDGDWHCWDGTFEDAICP